MRIYLTLDYELFMGNKTGTVENCLIKPTNKLLTVLDKYNVKATFFVDAAYLYQLDKLKFSYSTLNRDYDSIVKQLRDLSKMGHDIQLHIHPQWYYAKYDGCEWNLSSSPYKLSDMEERDCFDLFHKSKILLEQIIGKNVCAFRAGGYSIQTFNNLPKLFSDNDIKIDSSALSMKSSEGLYQVYDYSNVKSGFYYSFYDDVSKPSNTGPFIEIPITTSKICPLFVAYNFIKSWMIKSVDKTVFGDGVSINSINHEGKRSLISRIILYWKFINQQRMASIDKTNSLYLKYIYHSQLKNNVFVIIGHPKNLSMFSVNNLDVFLSSIYNKISFSTISLLNKGE